MTPKPPDVIVLGAKWPERALLRAQLIEEGHEVVALDTWPIPRLYRRAGMKPRVLLIDLHLEAADLASVAVAAPHPTMREMVEEADRHLLIVISEVRRAAKVADEHGDPGTVDLFSRVVQVHEKHEWWMRDVLRTGDGLCS